MEIDPLSLLRDSTLRNDLASIICVNDEYRFVGTAYSFPAATPTVYCSKLNIDPYTLETLIHFLKHSHLDQTDYLKITIRLSIPTVPFPDREPLIDYLLADSVNNQDGLLIPPETITLRTFKLSDVDDMKEWSTDDRVSRFCTWETHTLREQAVDFIQNFAIPHPWVRAICLENKAIRSISVAPGSGTGAGRAEIGYALGSKYWGKGIVTRAMRMVVETASMEWPHLVRLEALVDVENLGSQRVFEKVGFQKEGVLRRYAFIKGRSRDVMMFSLVCDVP